MGRGELEGERAQQLERMRKRNCCTRGESLFKEDSPARAPKTPQKFSPDAHQSSPAYGMGARAHKSYSWRAGLRVQRRRTATSEPPPAVVRLFISAENNGPVSDTGARAHESYSLGVGF
jgi:hypothetical protein